MDLGNAARLNPRSAQAYHARGQIYLDKGDYSRAIANQTEAVRLDPKAAEAYCDRGAAWLIAGDVDRALADFTRAIQINPHLAAAYDFPRRIWQQHGVLDRALADYTAAVAASPRLVEAYYGRGVVYAQTGQAGRAVADFAAVVRLDPKFVEPHSLATPLHPDAGAAEQAVRRYAALLQQNADSPLAHCLRGQAHATKGDLAAAIEDYTAAIRLQPDLAMAFALRGTAFGRHGEHDKAIHDCTEAIRLNPGLSEVYCCRGIARQARGDSAGALADYKTAIRLNPGMVEARVQRGNSYAAAGDAVAAIRDYTEAIRRQSEVGRGLFCPRTGICRETRVPAGHPRPDRRDRDGPQVPGGLRPACQSAPAGRRPRRGDRRLHQGDRTRGRLRPTPTGPAARPTPARAIIAGRSRTTRKPFGSIRSRRPCIWNRPRSTPAWAARTRRSSPTLRRLRWAEVGRGLSGRGIAYREKRQYQRAARRRGRGRPARSGIAPRPTAKAGRRTPSGGNSPRRSKPTARPSDQSPAGRRLLRPRLVFRPDRPVAQGTGRLHRRPQIDPKLVEARDGRGPNLRAHGQYDRRSATTIKSIRAQPSAAAYWRRGVVHEAKAEPELAIEDFNAAIDAKPQACRRLRWRRPVLCRGRHTGMAIADCNKALRTQTGSRHRLSGAGQAYAQRSATINAVRDYSAAIHIAPNYAEAFYRRRARLPERKRPSTRRLPTTPKPFGSRRRGPRPTPAGPAPTKRRATRQGQSGSGDAKKLGA